MTNEKLDELERLLKAGTPRPWELADWQDDFGENFTTICVKTPEVLRPGQSSIWPDGMECRQVANTDDGNNPLPDAALIVAAINALPELVARVREYQQALDRMMLPTDCRNRLEYEGKPYPKSSCLACKDWLFNGCPYPARAALKGPTT
jgi:hypothetical protein